MANVADSPSFHLDNELVIDDFVYRSDADIQQVYAESGDGGNPVVRDVDSAPLNKVGEFNGRFPITDSTHTSNWGVNGNLPISLDASIYAGRSYGVATKGKIKVKLTRSSTSAITAVSFKIGRDTSNCITWTPTLPNTTNTVDLEEDLANLSQTGTMDWSGIQTVEITVTSASGTPTLDLSGLRITASDRVTRGMWDEVATQTTVSGAKSLFYLAERATGDYSILHPEQDSSGNIFINQFAGKTMGNVFQITASFACNTASGSNTQVGIAFHTSDITQGSQDCYVAYVKFNGTTDTLNLDKIVAGSATSLATHDLFGAAGSSKVWLRVKGNNGVITVQMSQDGRSYSRNSVSIPSLRITDTTFTSGGFGTYSKGPGACEFFRLSAYDGRYVTFNNYSIYEHNILQMVDLQVESAPHTEFVTAAIPDANRDFGIRRNYKSKYITVLGHAITTDTLKFRKSLDELKQYIGASDMELKYGYLTGDDDVFAERIWKVNAISTEDLYDEENWKKTYLPFKLSFQAVDGIAESAGTISLPTNEFVGTLYSTVYEFKGSAAPLPGLTFTLIDITPDTGTITGITVVNNTTGQQITISPNGSFATYDVVYLDFKTRMIAINQSPVDYVGLCDDSFFKPGINRITINLLGTAQGVNQINDIPVSGLTYGIRGTARDYIAQAFTPSVTAPFKRFELYMYRFTTNPLGRFIKMWIETDSTNDPSGTPVHSSYFKQLSDSDLSTTPQWIAFDMNTSTNLTSGTKYWIKIQDNSQSAFPDQGIRYGYSTTSAYPNDSAVHASTPGGVWTNSTVNDMLFKAYGGSAAGLDIQVAGGYYPRWL